MRPICLLLAMGIRQLGAWRSRPRIACLVLVALAAVRASSQSLPMLVSSSPANGATGVATNTSLIFEFDQPMDIAWFPLEAVCL